MPELVDLDGLLAGELAARGEDPEAWTIVEDVLLGVGRWTEEHRRILRDGGGRHFAATYESPLTDSADGIIVARFEPVTPQVRQVTTYTAAPGG
jgi:hypothetical protein